MAINSNVEVFLRLPVEVEAGEVRSGSARDLSGRGAMKPFLRKEFLGRVEQPFFGGTAFLFRDVLFLLEGNHPCHSAPSLAEGKLQTILEVITSAPSCQALGCINLVWTD